MRSINSKAALFSLLLLLWGSNDLLAQRPARGNISRPTPSYGGRPASRPPAYRPPASRPPAYRPPAYRPPARYYPPHYGGVHVNFYVHGGYPVRYGFYSPAWYYPPGYAIATIATTAIIVSAVTAANSNEPQDGSVYYDNGVYYKKEGDKYVVIPAPEGSEVPKIPDGYTVTKVGETEYYYDAGVFYMLNSEKKYVVVSPPVGATVPYIPEKGVTKEKIGDATYYVYSGTYYLPKHSGENVTYEVVLKPVVQTEQPATTPAADSTNTTPPADSTNTQKQ